MKRLVCILIIISTCLLHTACMSARPKEESLLRVIFLDVGQGDCILLRTSAGDVLIDAGPEDSQDTLCRKLDALGVTELELAIFTHGDEDHIGGADGVLTRFPVKEVWISAHQGDSEASKRLLEACVNVQMRVLQESVVVKIGGVSVFAFAPIEADAENDGGIVLKVTYQNASALFTGDLSAAAEARLLEHYGALHLSCDLYKVAHHGSSDANSQVFLEAITPAWAVISCGAENSFGHPHGDVLLRLQRLGVRVFRTDLSGDVVFVCDGERFFPITND